MASAASTIVWPRLLTPTHLATLIRQQKNPSAALHLFNTAPLLYPTTYLGHTTSVYSALLRSLSSSPSHLPLLLSHLRHLILHHLPHSSPSLDPLLSRHLLSLPPSHALPLFRLLPPSDLPLWARSLHSILKLLISTRDFATAHDLLDEISPRTRMGLPSLNLTIDALCRLGRADLAIDVFMEIKEQCFYPDRDTYRILMRGLCESGRLDDATHLLYSMLWRISQKGCEADVVVYRMLLESLCEVGRIKQAEDVLGKVLLKGLRTPRKRRAFRKPELEGLSLEEMKARINEALVGGGVRSLKSYAAVIGDLYEEGRIGNADRLFDEMVERGFRPTVAMYEKRIAALCRNGRVGEAIRLLEVEMKERGCVPSVEAYGLVMEGLCEEGEARSAGEWLERMEMQVGCVARKESFEIVVVGYLREGRVLEAAKVLERMARRKYWPGSEVYSAVIRGLCSIGRLYEAVVWLEEMVSQAKVPDVSVWSSLVSVVCADYNSTGLVSCLDP